MELSIHADTERRGEWRLFSFAQIDRFALSSRVRRKLGIVRNGGRFT
jgi:hypothetical protein